MKMPPRRTKNRQAKEARKVLNKENEGQFALRIDKGLRMQFNLIAQFKNTSMNTILLKYINKYVDKNFNPNIEKGVNNLKAQSERRGEQ